MALLAAGRMVAEIPVGEGLRALLYDGGAEIGGTHRCSPTDNRAKRITKPGEEKLELGI